MSKKQLTTPTDDAEVESAPDHQKNPDKTKDRIATAETVDSADAQREAAREAKEGELEEAAELAKKIKTPTATNGVDPLHPETLTPEEESELAPMIEAFHKEKNWTINPAAPHPTAIEYKGFIVNYSTWTRIATLSTGKKVFIVYAFPLSDLNRSSTNLMHALTGSKIRKVSKSNWPGTFRERTNIPIIWGNGKDTVVMPYIPNVNMDDLLGNSEQIKDWGPHEWAKNIDLPKKLEICKQIIDEIAKIHEKGKAWGEAQIVNMIYTEERKVYICDPETPYLEDTTFVEQRARDFRDVVMCCFAGLKKAHGFDDVQGFLDMAFAQYAQSIGGKEVLEFLKANLTGDLSLGEHLGFAFTSERLSKIKKSDYQRIKAEMKNSTSLT